MINFDQINSVKSTRFVIDLVFIFFLGFVSCNTENKNEELPQLYAKWIWIQSSGGIDGRTIAPNENEPAKYLQFVKPDIIESYIGDSLISSGTFTLKKFVYLFFR